MQKTFSTISSIFEKSFNKANELQIARKTSQSAFVAEQLFDIKTFASFISNSRHWAFRFAFAFISFKIFLFCNKRIIIVVNFFSSTTILILRSSRVLFKKDQNILTHGFLTRIHSKHFRRENEFFITIQKRSKSEQQSQKKFIDISYWSISAAARRWLSFWDDIMMKLSKRKIKRKKNNVTCLTVRIRY